MDTPQGLCCHNSLEIKYLKELDMYPQDSDGMANRHL